MQINLAKCQSNFSLCFCKMKNLLRDYLIYSLTSVLLITPCFSNVERQATFKARQSSETHTPLATSALIDMPITSTQIDRSDLDTPEGKLAIKFSPILCFDSNENYEPRDATIMWNEDNAERKISDNRKYLDLRGVTLTQGPNAYRKKYGELVETGKYPMTVYARVCTRDQHTILQYWFLYLFNEGRYLNDVIPWFHEGDWEMIQMVFYYKGVQEVLDSGNVPDIIVYSQHETAEVRDWSSLGQLGFHPYVYVARGSHANYFDIPGTSEIASGFRLKLLERMDAEGNIFVADCSNIINKFKEKYTLDLLPEPEDTTAPQWLKFDGLWGEIAPGTTEIPYKIPYEQKMLLAGITLHTKVEAFVVSGPESPAYSTKWKDPLGWMKTLRGFPPKREPLWWGKTKGVWDKTLKVSRDIWDKTIQFTSLADDLRTKIGDILSRSREERAPSGKQPPPVRQPKAPPEMDESSPASTVTMAPHIWVSPPSGPPGVLFNVRITGCTPNNKVRVDIGGTEREGWGSSPQETCSTDGRGNASTTISFDYRGKYFVRVLDKATGMKSEPVTVTVEYPAVNPTIMVSPPSGSKGTVFDVRITGCTPNNKARVDIGGTEREGWGSSPQETLSTDGRGNASTTIRFDYRGKHFVRVLDKATDMKSEPVTVTVR